MYNKNNVKRLKEIIGEMNLNDRIYINSINLTKKGIDVLRRYIKSGVLVPEREEVEELYKNVEAVMSGDVILPQMTYVKEA